MWEGKLARRIVPDTSVIISGRLAEAVEKGKLKTSEIVIPIAVLDELQAQASKGRHSGFIGLKELGRLREACQAKGVKVKFSGEKPSLDDIRLASSGRIDSIIMDVALKEKAELATADYVQALTAEARGLKVLFFQPEEKVAKLRLENLFTPDTMSIHLKEGAPPIAKRGKPGEFKLVKLKGKPLTAEQVEAYIREVYELAKVKGKGFVEIDRGSAFVAQIGDLRVAVARPPFSDGVELTAVRPIVKLRLEDYKLSDKLMDRLKHRAEGILIAGPPGSGKTTFASSLAEFYMAQGKIVKTLESPRDLQVDAEITQYGPLEGSFEKSADILLLVRPDYTVFDEVRKTQDFTVFTDMRLAGVGMIGVIHASSPIDAIQRFIGRVELGMIPHVVDTLIFIRYGVIEKVYELTLTVKVPTGMTDEALARPVIEVKDFEEGQLDYEIYTFGEENVVIPVSPEKPKETPAGRLAAQRILEEVRKISPEAQVEVSSAGRATIRVDKASIPHLIGRKGSTIGRLEKKLGIKLDVKPFEEPAGPAVEYELQETRRGIDFYFSREIAGRKIAVLVDGEIVLVASVGRKAKVRVSGRSPPGRKLTEALTRNREITVRLVE
ncbi:MAG: ATPase [Candidatus Hecatellales archaeon B24]|nr:MAG: ATPase [Candidatus Hecatellales archaeon B24]